MTASESRVKVSMIIVNYHSSALINECLDSIYIQTPDSLPFEIIIVDNASEDLTVSISHSPNDNLKFIQLTQNIGFGRANNAGAEIARGEYLFFLNPDTLLLNDAIGILYRFMDDNELCGIAGGNLFSVDNKPNISFRRITPGVRFEMNEIFHLIPEKLAFKENRFFNHTGKPLKVAHISGADLMIRKDIFDKLGGFSPEFFMYYEETDLCRRVSKAGWKLYSVPEAKIIHLEGGTFQASQNERKIKMTEKGRMIYYKRNLSPFPRFVGNSLYKIFLLSRIILSKDSNRKKYYQTRLEWCKSFQHSR